MPKGEWYASLLTYLALQALPEARKRPSGGGEANT